MGETRACGRTACQREGSATVADTRTRMLAIAPCARVAVGVTYCKFSGGAFSPAGGADGPGCCRHGADRSLLCRQIQAKQIRDGRVCGCHAELASHERSSPDMDSFRGRTRADHPQFVEISVGQKHSSTPTMLVALPQLRALRAQRAPAGDAVRTSLGDVRVGSGILLVDNGKWCDCGGRRARSERAGAAACRLRGTVTAIEEQRICLQLASVLRGAPVPEVRRFALRGAVSHGLTRARAARVVPRRLQRFPLDHRARRARTASAGPRPTAPRSSGSRTD